MTREQAIDAYRRTRHWQERQWDRLNSSDLMYNHEWHRIADTGERLLKHFAKLF